jgi:hypothetical protein
MAATGQTPFQHSAQLRWPKARITGDGQFALVASCCENKTVRLYVLYPEAAMDCQQPCSHAFCHLAHRVYQIRAVFAGAAPVLRSALWEDD